MIRSIASLRHRLKIEAPADVLDGEGGVTRQFVATGELWACIEPVRGAHGFVADRQEQVLTHRVHIRWREGLRAGMRFRTGERLLEIRSIVDPDERRVRLVCSCEEVDA